MQNIGSFPGVIAGSEGGEKRATLIETPNKKEADKIAGAFLLKGRRDGFAGLSFPVVPSISSASPVGIPIFICLAQ